MQNTFHPHVWFKGSEDVFRRNIVFRSYAPIRVAKPWGKQTDYNLLRRPGLHAAVPASALQQESGRDEHSLAGDAMFVDPAKGDYRVQPGSPALSLGFVNFSMDQSGVRTPKLKAIARTPKLPAMTSLQSETLTSTREAEVST